VEAVRSNRGKVLVVDDREESLAVFAMTIARAGFEVDTATSLSAALEKIRAVTYDIAVVDIDLVGDGNNEDGIEILDFINNIGEGTLGIVLSAAGMDKPQLVADMLQVHRAFRFVAKMALVKPGGSRLLVDAVEAALGERVIQYYGRRDNILNLLSAEEGEGWIDRLIEGLSPKAGYQGLRRFLEELFEGFLPILAPRDLIAASPDRRSGAWLTEEGSGGFAGQFWSKGQGTAIEVFICRVSSGRRVKNDGSARLRVHSNFGISGVVDKSDLKREAFTPQ